MKFKICLLVVLFTISSCKKEKVGGKCEYTDTTKNVAVTFIDGGLDAEFTVSFQPIGVDTDEIYRVTSKQLKKITKNFKTKQLENKKNKYQLTISEITKGSCVPFVIKEIELQR